MDYLLHLVLIFGLLFHVDFVVSSSSSLFNVFNYGAINNRNIDSSPAFLKAWDAVCSSEADEPSIIVPRGNTFLVKPIVFTGPCKAKKINFLVSGKIVAPPSPSAWKGLDSSQWLVFSGVSGLRVLGTGTFDGQGFGWWSQSCKYHPELVGCTNLAPTVLKLFSCNETKFAGVSFINSPQTHISALGCNGLHISKVTIKSPGDSPNTDGIHLQNAEKVVIRDSTIGAGDDCVSIGDYTSNINILNITCGPGHGVSIGSLGKTGNYVRVHKIFVRNVYFKGTTNGARIKTWQVGQGYVRKIVFENLFFNSVQNPIIIDQNYCDVRDACEEKETGVHISDITYKELKGTSASEVGINLNCSNSVPCSNLVLDSINLKPAIRGQQIISHCANAHGLARGLVQPSSCLRN